MLIGLGCLFKLLAELTNPRAELDWFHVLLKKVGDPGRVALLERLARPVARVHHDLKVRIDREHLLRENGPLFPAS